MTEDHGRLAIAGGRAPMANGQLSVIKPALGVWVENWVNPKALLAFADRYRWPIWGVVLVVYLAAFNGQWRVQPDAALYLSLGRNLATGRGFTYLGEPNLLAYPGWPTLIAITFKIFGTHSLLAVNGLMMLISLSTVGMVYRLFLLYSGRPTAVVMSAGVALTKAFFCYGFELWSDMPFALGAVSALAGYEGLFGRRITPALGRSTRSIWVDGFFFFGGVLLAATMRPTIWPLLAAIGITLTIQAVLRQITWVHYLALCAVAVLLATVIFAITCYHSGGHGFGRVYEQYLLNRLTGKSDDALSHPLAENVRDLFSWAASDVLFQTRLGGSRSRFWPNELLSMLVLGLGFSLFRFRLLWGFWFCLLLATIMVSQDALDRYFLPVLPLLVYAWWKLVNWSYWAWKDWSVNLSLPGALPGLVFLALLSFGCVMNITKVGGIIVQQREQPFLANYDKGTFDTAPQFARLLRDAVDDSAIVLIRPPYGRVTEYLSDRFVVGSPGIAASQLQHCPVFIVEPSDLPTQRLLRDAGLIEGPALFTVNPSPGHGPAAVSLSLHSTRRR